MAKLQGTRAQLYRNVGTDQQPVWELCGPKEDVNEEPRALLRKYGFRAEADDLLRTHPLFLAPARLDPESAPYATDLLEENGRTELAAQLRGAQPVSAENSLVAFCEWCSPQDFTGWTHEQLLMVRAIERASGGKPGDLTFVIVARGAGMTTLVQFGGLWGCCQPDQAYVLSVFRDHRMADEAASIGRALTSVRPALLNLNTATYFDSPLRIRSRLRLQERSGLILCDAPSFGPRDASQQLADSISLYSTFAPTVVFLTACVRGDLAVAQLLQMRGGTTMR